MFTPSEYAIASPEQSRAMGLPAIEHGVLMGHDEDGNRVTRIGDADYVRMLQQADPSEYRGLVDGGEGLFPLARAGWPPNWD